MKFHRIKRLLNPEDIDHSVSYAFTLTILYAAAFILTVALTTIYFNTP